MADLKKTSVSEAHYHLVYIYSDPKQQLDPAAPPLIGITSIDGLTPHYHNVILTPGLPEVRDEVGNITQQAIPSEYKITPAQGDNHVHEIEGLKLEELKEEWKTQSDVEAVTEIKSLFKQAHAHDQEFLEEAKKDEEFYMGDQWDEKDKNRLKAAKRASLTLNEIEGKIDVLSGFYRQNRYDITFFPTEGGEQLVADILSNLGKHTLETNNFDYREAEVFEDKTITGRGNFRLWIDYSKDIRGDIKVIDMPYDKVFYGEHRHKDCFDLEYLCAWDWMSKQKLKQLYPDNADEIETDFNFSKLLSKPDTSDIPADVKDKYAIDSDSDVKTEDQIRELYTDKEFVDVKEKKYRVIELHKKIATRVKVIVNLNDDYVEDRFFYENLDKELREKLKTLPGFALIPQTKEKIIIMTCAGNVLLGKEESELADCWSIVPDYAKKRGSKVWGKVRAMKEHQEMINKIHSSSIDIISRMAVYGWMYDTNTFSTETQKSKFISQSSTPGFVLEIGSTQSPPMKFEGAKYPSELVQTQEFISRKMMQNSNINPELLGMSSQSQQSKSSFVEKRSAALIGNEFLFDNSSLAKRMFGRALLRAIIVVFGRDPERVARILQNRIQRQQQVMGESDISKYSLEEIMAAINKKDLSRYDVVVGESMYSPTRKQAVFNYLVDLAKAGMQIPPEIFYELSEMPAYIKRQIAQYNQQNAAAAQGQEHVKQNAEIVKTIIANLPDNMKEDPRIMMALGQQALNPQGQQPQPQQ